MSDPEYLKEEKPYRRAYRHARDKYHQYTQRWWATIQSVSHHCRTQRQKYGGWEQEKKFFEVAAVILILIYTAIQGCQLWVIRDQEKRQLRAYVLVNQSLITIDTSNNVHARIQIKNDGLTPAYQVAGWGCLVVGRFKFYRNTNILGVEIDLPSGDPGNWENIPKSIIGPGDTKEKLNFAFCAATPPVYRSLTADEYTRLRDGTAAIYMYGEEIYIDAFGDRRFLKYRFFSTGNMAWGAGNTVDDMRGNDAN